MDIDAKLAALEERLKAYIDTRMAAQADADTRQLAVVRQDTQALVVAASKQVYSNVIAQVSAEINEKIVPQVNRMVERVNYQTEDGCEVVDEYRHMVREHYVGDNLMLTGADTPQKPVISPFVGVYFDDAD